MERIEIYVLSSERTSKLVCRFLELSAPERTEAAEDYPWPQYADDPKHVYDSSNELLRALERDSHEPYSVYWHVDGDGAVQTAMVFFTTDGCVIVGIAVLANAVAPWFEKMAKAVGGEYGYVDCEAPPPDTRDDFIRLCNASDQTRLIAGEVIQTI